MKPVLNKRNAQAQGQICTAVPACPENAILYLKMIRLAWGAGLFLTMKNVMRVVSAPANAAGMP